MFMILSDIYVIQLLMRILGFMKTIALNFGIREENRTLGQTRDLLLPKLMSGEIHLPEAEIAGEAVA